MVGWHQHDGRESEQTPGDTEGRKSLVCCSPWGCKELDMTQQLNNVINQNDKEYFQKNVYIWKAESLC